jgi:hypothetical protein
MMTDPNAEPQDPPRASVAIEHLLQVLIGEVQVLIHELRIQNALRAEQTQRQPRKPPRYIGISNNDSELTHTDDTQQH